MIQNTEDIVSTVGELASSIDTVWVLIATALVMFMQAGFMLVETGFTRAKNTTNIMMKNIMDFSFGSLLFWFIGFSIMFGADIGGFIGEIDLFFSNGFEGDIPGTAFLMFQTVFAATAATIVSGAVAERTEFKAYLLFSIILTAVIYPISGHWIWGGGWLAEMGFHDFAGSTVVHSVGAWVGLVGAYMVGPRIGKYNGKAKAIPGQSLLMGALGVFILWLGWFGFNPGSQLAASGSENAAAISHIFLTTNLAGATGGIVSMMISWVQFKKPTLSLTLNGALAGLVGITAGTDIVDPMGAVAIGAISGTALVFAVEFIDTKLRIDDPVGAVSVHGVAGSLGTIMVGLFATEGGLFYGGGTDLLVTQIIGVLSVMAWALSTGFVLFFIIKKTVGLRVPNRVEEEGLDIYEHGESAYFNQ